ncbi:alkaline phosphatase family protein [Actinomyces slackii]|uniref:Type I phosphodiesterase / nucleotide pyrophosphatase n=1 Tax=Actinomyces slackii TaxID=52774 RepID=A0A448KDR1_9ACTO|nr:alkaline phosphatase family protein [Actinomyces slackii]VEG75063.1 Type I phosphodiesterase / nucleotide pyrophosphatase [Actinomyces slackii]
MSGAASAAGARAAADHEELGLGHVLAAAAVGAGLTLADPGPVGSGSVLSDAQARRAAQAWGIAQSAPTVLVLVDGLGLEQLLERRGHAPTLRAWLAGAQADGRDPRLSTCLPSTTAAAITTLGTTAPPGATGMVGYSVLSPLLGPSLPAGTVPHPDQLLSLIAWQGAGLDPRAWQDVPCVFERLRTEPQAEPPDEPLAVSIGPARFAGSGLTEAGLRGARHVGADRLENRPALAARALRQGAPLVYLYVGELDHAGHLHGWRSPQWLTRLEHLDAAMADLERRVPPGTRIILTADHGMVDTDASHRIDLSAEPDLARGIVAVAGEPRFTHLHVADSDPDLAERVAKRYRQALGDRAAWVGTREQVGALMGPLGERARGVVGDVVVVMDGAWVLVDPRVHAPAAIAMPGVHGGLTRAETGIPLLIAG